jgi:hypothetical protein
VDTVLFQSYRSVVGIIGCSFQFGRTSTRLPPHLLHFARRWNDGASVPGRIASFRQWPMRMHAQLAHVAERHRRAGLVREVQ